MPKPKADPKDRLVVSVRECSCSCKQGWVTLYLGRYSRQSFVEVEMRPLHEAVKEAQRVARLLKIPYVEPN